MTWFITCDDFCFLNCTSLYYTIVAAIPLRPVSEHFFLVVHLFVFIFRKSIHIFLWLDDDDTHFLLPAIEKLFSSVREHTYSNVAVGLNRRERRRFHFDSTNSFILAIIVAFSIFLHTQTNRSLPFGIVQYRKVAVWGGDIRSTMSSFLFVFPETRRRK